MRRRISLLLAALVMVLAQALPATAATWTILECQFSGINWLEAGNRAWARTTDSNSQCGTLYVKVRWKVDGEWYTSTTATTPYGQVQINSPWGADDSAGVHAAYSGTSGVWSGWKYSY